MDRRRNILLLIPLLTALVAFLATDRLVFTAVGFLVGYLVIIGLRAFLLPPFLHQAIKHFQRGNLDGALRLATLSVEKRPDRWESYYLRAVTHFALSNLLAAEGDARRAIELNPRNDTGHVTLGQVLFSQKRFAEAKQAFSQAVKLRGREATNQYHLGATLFRLGDYESAAPRLELATRLGIPDPNLDLLAQYYLGVSFDRSGRSDEAEAVFDQLRPKKDALYELKQHAETVASYPALRLLQEDIASLALLIDG